MTDEPPPPLDDASREILESVKRVREDDARVLRVRQQLSARIGVVPPTDGGSGSPGASSTTTAKVLLVAAVPVGLLAGWLFWRASHPDTSRTSPTMTTEAPTAPAAASSPTISATATTVVSPPPIASETSSPPVATYHPPHPTAPASTGSEPVDTLAAERALLARAQQELSAGRPAAAREIYEKHLAEFPKGVLRVEAAVGRVVALCAMKDPSSPAEAKKVLATPLPAALATRVRTACDVE